MVHVSCAPSKIPYVGFSPVRLQTEIRPRPSRNGIEVKHKACMRSAPHRLYVTKVLAPEPCSPRACRAGSVARTTRSRGPWLPGRFCCPPSSSLTMASSETLTCFLRLIFFVRRIFALRPRLGCRRELPQFKQRVCSTAPSPVPRLAGRLLLVISSPTTMALSFFAQARRPTVPTYSGPAWVGVSRLQSSLHATARRIACPSPARTFTYELSSLESPPSKRRI